MDVFKQRKLLNTKVGAVQLCYSINSVVFSSDLVSTYLCSIWLLNLQNVSQLDAKIVKT